VERGGSQDATQGRSGKGSVGGTTAGGDDEDGGLGRRMSGDGNPGLSQSLVVSPEEIQPEVGIIKNRPLSTMITLKFVGGAK
jgi:hypothetical protein